ncbi:MAG: endonuclease/exonuclease/phosphatase family protein, partial [Ignavibacteriales bacterium]|nr:endonuclease/exonuclease/phosphatase family protein [Ignavibacteriales bacterium]
MNIEQSDNNLATRLIFSLLVSLFLFTNQSSSQSSCDSTFRVMSFNIRYNNPGDSLNSWQYRKERVAQLIRYHKADVCGLQEALTDQIHDLTSLLPDFAWYGVGREDGKSTGEYCPIFYRRNRFQLIQHGTFWLSPFPDSVGSRGWDAALPRRVTWGCLEEHKTGKIFFVMNTHFDHKGETARRMSASLLLDSVKSKIAYAPVIVTGDFNSDDSSDVYQKMVDQNSTTPLLVDGLYES